jgi:hypothetical protein
LVGIDAFDLREYEIDISPWISIIADGKQHTFEIQVLGLSDDGYGNAKLGTVGSYWVVTGKVFVWHGDAPETLSAARPILINPEPDIFISSSTDGPANNTLSYQVAVQRKLFVKSTSRSLGQDHEWSQKLSYSNIGEISAQGTMQTNAMMISGFESSGSYRRKFTYPLQVTSEFKQEHGTHEFSIRADVDFSKNVQFTGNSVFTSPIDALSGQESYDSWLMTNRQNGSAYYFSDGKKSGSSGSTEQHLILKAGKHHGDSGLEESNMTGDVVYVRHVLARKNTIIFDSDADSTSESVVMEQASSDFAPVAMKQVVGGKAVKSMEM